jgi:hypothetical protein
VKVSNRAKHMSPMTPRRTRKTGPLGGFIAIRRHFDSLCRGAAVSA